ncbi:hypothetical protein ABQH43_01495 [Streptococcus sp. ZJ100]|uniref:hypothetical protein n=1 Tax=Streptococcus handemini TaxID=3161188 RepID=UPI0032EDA3B0
MELFNTIIGTLAFIISVIALGHSIYYNLVKIKLSDCEIERVDEHYDSLYSFSVANLSNVSVEILNIQIFDRQGRLLNDNGYDPITLHKQKYETELKNHQHESALITALHTSMFIPLNSYWKSKPFKRPTEVFPASKEHFSYYLDDEPAVIKITTNKRIYKFHKSQSFLPHFDDNR